MLEGRYGLDLDEIGEETRLKFERAIAEGE
jgi:hypothetical protein